MKEKLEDFIKARLGVSVTDSTLIFDQLNIDGLDAENFMIEFSETFNVDLSDFDPTKYYSSEYELSNLFLTIYRLLFNRKLLTKNNFSVAHLRKVIECGKWIDP